MHILILLCKTSQLQFIPTQNVLFGCAVAYFKTLTGLDCFYFPRHQNSHTPYDKMDVMLRFLSHSSPNSILDWSDGGGGGGRVLKNKQIIIEVLKFKFSVWLYYKEFYKER